MTTHMKPEVDIGCLPQSLSTFLKQGLLLNLELAEQEAPGMLLPPLPQHQDYRHNSWLFSRNEFWKSNSG